MKHMTLKQIALVCGGVYCGPEEDRDREVTEIVTDSRKITPGSLFVAIRGERVDGHRFIPAAYSQGACCVICEEAPQGAFCGNSEEASEEAHRGSGEDSSEKVCTGNSEEAPQGACRGNCEDTPEEVRCRNRGEAFEKTDLGTGKAKEDGSRKGQPEEGLVSGIGEPEDGKKKTATNTGAYIKVSSSLQAIKDMAEYYRQQLNVKVVGITGSVGKTSTKEIIASVLSEKYRVLKTLGNFNNELGLPLTVFRLREDDEVAVLEMGINHFGEMHRLSKIARPDLCVITNIGQCHLEFLGDRDGVLRAKSEIFDYLAPDGQIVLNGDDDKLAALTDVKGITPIFFGLESGREIRADEIEPMGLKGIRCRIHARGEEFTVTVPIPGIHMVRNALAATAVGLALGLTTEEIRRGIEKLEALNGRFHIIEKNGLTVIDDCYNANPVSMKASLQALEQAQGRKVAILGDMGELGDCEKELHREVGAFAAKLDLQQVLCVGPLSGLLADAIGEENPGISVAKAADLQEALEKLPELVRSGDTILVKASHAMHFEKLVAALTREKESEK